MNKNVKYAMKINEFDYVLPDVEIGDVVDLSHIWDGSGDVPTKSCSYLLRDNEWINYVFDILDEKDDPLDTVIEIIDIQLL